MTVFTETWWRGWSWTFRQGGRPPLVLGLADLGTSPDGALQAWVQQDRIFVVEERRVVAAGLMPTACRRGCALRAAPSSSPDLLRP